MLSSGAKPVDPAFRALKSSLIAFQIWRVEKMSVVQLPRDQWGKFCRGDSYIVYCANEEGHGGDPHLTPREVKGKPLEMHIHFWLGSQTSQDEAGVAAYKSIELDDHLGGNPVQHREVEGKESKRFLSYFRSGIRYLDGGVASGFRHVTDEHHPTMYHIKGKRIAVVSQVPVSWEQVNDGDVYVLDMKKILFVWTGKYANNKEMLQGALTAQKLKEEHGGGVIVFVEDGKEKSMDALEFELFNRCLKLSEKHVTSHEQAPSDEKVVSEIKLYRCSDESGTLRVTEVKTGPLYQSDLTSQDSFIVDNGSAGIFVWIGKQATPKERAEAMRNAIGFIKKKGYLPSTPVTRVIDGGEPLEFRSLFQRWVVKDQTLPGSKSTQRGNIAKIVQTSFDASTLHENPQLAADTQMFDDGTGHKEVWRIEDFDIKEVDLKDHGKFYAGDCYIVLYCYSHGSEDRFILYYWLGSKSSLDEQGSAATWVVQMDDKLNGKATQVRLVQGKETPHFMAIFDGKMTIFAGGLESSFDRSSGRQGFQRDSDSYLLHVRGMSPMNTKAIEVPCRAASLNSNDVFVLYTPNSVYVWNGKGSTGDEREMARRLASGAKVEPATVYEGQEKSDFWTAIGGKEPYANDHRLQELKYVRAPRLFQCSNVSGNFRVEEIVNFDQSDLLEDDVMLLDAGEELYIWIGNGSNAAEKKEVKRAAMDYLSTDPSKRDLDTPILIVKQGFEPPSFTGFFGVWQTSFWDTKVSYSQLIESIRAANAALETLHIAANGSKREVTVYPLSKLIEKTAEELPFDVDPANKEKHLSPEDFQEAFQITRDHFDGLPQWKQVQMKKKVGLF